MIQRYYRLAGYLLPVLIVCTSLVLLGARAKPSGADPYTLTKAEWLCVRYNMTQMRKWNRDIPYEHYARPAGDPNTIELVLLFTPLDRVDPVGYRQLANQEMAQGRIIIENLAKRYGFDDWLVIRESFQETEQKKEK